MLWVFLVYLTILLVLGFVAERYTKGLEGFLLGDRKMGPWLTALSYEATAYSGWLMLGFPGRGFSRGQGAMWAGVACVVGDSLNWLLVSKRLRDETARLRTLTIPEYLERRFAKQGGHAIQAAASAPRTSTWNGSCPARRSRALRLLSPTNVFCKAAAGRGR